MEVQMPKTLNEALNSNENQGGNPDESQDQNPEVSKIMDMMDQIEAMMEDPAMLKMMQEGGVADRLKQIEERLMPEEEPQEDDLTWEDTRASANDKMNKRGL
jgi:hypothetical protein